MKLYAELPARRTRQILADLSAVAWAALWGWVAYLIHQAITSLAAITRTMTRDGDDLGDSLNGAAKEAREIPFVGKALGQRLADAAGVAQSVAQAGRDGEDTIGRVALVAALAVVLGGVVPVVAVWLAVRVRWALRARTALALRGEPAGRDLLALRALAGTGLRRLRQVSDDPAGGWRAADPETIAALAKLELATLGLHSR